jgi:hypothetical protein
VLLGSLIAAPDAILDTVSYVIGRCLLVTAWGRLSARRCGVVHDRLVVDRMLGDDVAWLLECAFEEAALFALPRALFAATG